MCFIGGHKVFQCFIAIKTCPHMENIIQINLCI